MRCGRASAPALLAIASALLLVAPLPATSQRYRESTISASDRLAELLSQVGGDGQPENIGYGFQRANIESPALSREILDRVVDNIILERAAEVAETPKERPVSSFRERNRERRNYGHAHSSEALVGPQNAPTDPEDPEKNSPADIDDRVAAALQDLWVSLPEERLSSSPTVVDELSDQDAALLLEELGRESVGDNRRGTWASYPEEYPSVRYLLQQPLRSDHRIGRRWLPQKQDLPPEHQYMQLFRHGTAGSNPSDYGKNRLSKRSPLRLATDAKVRDDLMHIFGSSDTGSKESTPENSPLSTTSAPYSEPTTVASTSTTTDRQSGAHAPMAPSGEGNGTLHKDHENVHDHEHEQAKHAPPMLSAEGRQPFTREAPGKPKGFPEKNPGEDDENSPVEEPRAMELRLHKKSVRWSDYFGIDRRRRRTPTESVTDTEDDGGLLQRYLQVLFAQADQEGDGGQPRSLEKRVAVKKDAADVLAEESARCPAVAPLVKDCSLAVGEFDELLSLCALHRACHLCGAIIAAWPQSCDAALRTRSAEVCGANGACIGRAARLAARISAPGGDACTRHPCLVSFLNSDADTDEDDPEAGAAGFSRLGTLNNNSRR